MITTKQYIKFIQIIKLLIYNVLLVNQILVPLGFLNYYNIISIKNLLLKFEVYYYHLISKWIYFGIVGCGNARLTCRNKNTFLTSINHLRKSSKMSFI
jgi:hypothetical protein